MSSICLSSHRRATLRNLSRCEEEDLNLHSFRNQNLNLDRRMT